MMEIILTLFFRSVVLLML